MAWTACYVPCFLDSGPTLTSKVLRGSSEEGSYVRFTYFFVSLNSRLESDEKEEAAAGDSSPALLLLQPFTLQGYFAHKKPPPPPGLL